MKRRVLDGRQGTVEMAPDLLGGLNCLVYLLVQAA